MKNPLVFLLFAIFTVTLALTGMIKSDCAKQSMTVDVSEAPWRFEAAHHRICGSGLKPYLLLRRKKKP